MESSTATNVSPFDVGSMITQEDVDRMIAEEKERALESERRHVEEQRQQWERETQTRILVSACLFDGLLV